MVDEYQDTNGAQFQIVKAITDKHRNLCVVGDDDQSIYGWRGAEIANLLDLEKHYPEVKVIKLEQNYRSTNTILQAANALIRHNPLRRPKQLWSQKGQGDKIRLQTFETDEEEARTVVDEIECDRLTERIPWGEQAILFRTNLQSRALETALRQASVRYHLIGGQSFFDRREVRDLVAYLKVMVNPHDDVSLLRIANVPPRGLSDLTMERLLAASQERHCSVFAAMRHTDVQGSFLARSSEAIRDFTHLIENQRTLLANPALAHDPRAILIWAERFLAEIGYLEDLRRSEKNPENADNRVRNLKELIATIDGEELAAPAERIESFLEGITLDSEREEEKETAGDAVTLITMHSCKGLEFPHVHIVGVEDGLLPHARSKLEGTLDEERRLFYVAITRAMKTLTISYSLGRKRYGETIPCHPSPFLKDLPSELIEDVAETSRQPVSKDHGKSLFANLKAALRDNP
jgi:superfamily I DNA/RNA helicase